MSWIFRCDQFIQCRQQRVGKIERNPPLAAGVTRNGFQLQLGACGLEALPLTAATLEDEAQQWAGIGSELKIHRDA